MALTLFEMVSLASGPTMLEITRVALLQMVLQMLLTAHSGSMLCSSHWFTSSTTGSANRKKDYRFLWVVFCKVFPVGCFLFGDSCGVLSVGWFLYGVSCGVILVG